MWRRWGKGKGKEGRRLARGGDLGLLDEHLAVREAALHPLLEQLHRIVPAGEPHHARHHGRALEGVKEVVQDHLERQGEVNGGS